MSGVLDLGAAEFPISPSPDAAPFWDSVERGELSLPFCPACATPFWYPRNLCPRCGNRDLEWVTYGRQGVVHAFCIQHHSSLPHLRALTPFVTALVDLDAGVRMMGLVDVAPDPTQVGCDLRVEFDVVATAGGRRVPVFIPVRP